MQIERRGIPCLQKHIAVMVITLVLTGTLYCYLYLFRQLKKENLNKLLFVTFVFMIFSYLGILIIINRYGTGYRRKYGSKESKITIG
jgi:uncharacterized membrane protein YpjA